MKRLITVLLLFTVARLSAQNITSAEYFFDADPGLGNGIPIAIPSPGSDVNITAAIPVNTLNAGFHFLAIRVKDADGKWGLYERRSFYVSSASADMPIITSAEYFYDNDPGIGNGTALVLSTPGNLVSQTFTVPVPQGLTQGDHILTIRVKDQAGTWSLFEKDTLTINDAVTITCPANATATATNFECVAVVNGIDPVISQQGAAYTYTLSGATTGSGNGTASGKVFNAGTTTVTYALVNSPITSCSFTVTVNADVVPSVSIYTPGTTICAGTEVTFLAMPTNGGFTPTYQWKRNGVNVGTNSNTYRDSTLNNGDSITVVMTSSIVCANTGTATSGPVVMTVNPTIIPSVSISATASSICAWQPVTFTASPVNGGSNPTYNWRVNNYLFQTTTNTFQIGTLLNGDSVSVIMHATEGCVNSGLAYSDWIHMTVNSNVTPSVTIATPQTTICSGTPATFTATPVNGGSSPAYQWKVNGNNVGDNSPSYESSAINNGDNVSVVMTSSLSCANPQSAASTPITITVLPSTPAVVNITASATTICSGSPVTFTVTSVNPGATYQWQLNGNNIQGATSTTYQTPALQNGDKVKVIMTPSSPCAFPSPAVSNEIIMAVNSDATPTVSIDASATTICSGQNVTFTATPLNAGSNIVYEWILNNNAVGSNSPVYQNASLVNGDKIKVTMVSWQGCGGYSQAVSNTINITVSTGGTPSVSISASAIDICAGTPVTFTATPANGGSNPHFQWKLNGNNVGGDSAWYHSSTLSNADTVRVLMTSSLSCATTATAISNYISMDVTIPVTPAVTISSPATNICPGQTISFTATPVNGGAVPGYQWKLNGENVGNNDDTYSTNTLQNGDIVSVVMTTSVPCSTSPTATANSVTINLATEICGNGTDDDCDGSIDENCTTELPLLLVKTYPVKEGDAGYSILNVEVKLDHPGASPVSVNYATANANATAGLDYVPVNGTLTIPVGAVSGTIQLRIIADLLPENNESFWLNFSNPVNVLLGSDPRARIMIIDDDKGKPTTRSSNLEMTTDKSVLKIPTVVKRNQPWIIPRIGDYENEVLITNVQGQLVTRFINYKSQTAVGNVAAGLYFYRIRISEGGQFNYYSGRLLITE